MGDRRGGSIDQQDSLAGGEPLIAPIACLPQRAGTDAARFDNGFHQPVAYCAASLPTPKLAITECDTEQSGNGARSEVHTSELPSLTRISSAFFCLKTK